MRQVTSSLYGLLADFLATYSGRPKLWQCDALTTLRRQYRRTPATSARLWGHQAGKNCCARRGVAAQSRRVAGAGQRRVPGPIPAALGGWSEVVAALPLARWVRETRLEP
jgi:hypothetical protein